MPINRKDLTFMRSWTENMRVFEGKSPSTIRDYEYVILAWLRYRNGQPCASATHADIKQFLNRPRVKVAQASPATLSREQATLKSFYSHAFAELNWSNPTVALPKRKRARRLPRPADPKVWVEVWSQELSDEQRVLFGLAYWVGLRRGEIARLEVSKVGDRDLRVVRKGDVEDVVPYKIMCDLVGDAEVFLGALQRFMALRSHARFLMPYYESQPQRPGTTRKLEYQGNRPNTLSDNTAVYLRDLGVPGGFGLHQLRHSCATNLVRAGVDLMIVKTLLNHASVATTQLYVEVSGQDIERYARRFTQGG